MSPNYDCLAVGLSPAIQKTLIFDAFEQGEVNRSEFYVTDAAGKCINVARVLTQGGMLTSCLTIAGRENRDEFEALCQRDSLDLTVVETSGRVRTCTTLIETDSTRCSEIVANEPEVITPDEESAFKNAYIQMLSRGFKSVIISGSKFKGFSENIIPNMVRLTKEKGILLIVDYRGADLKNSYISKKIRPDYVKINEDEFIETFGKFTTLEEGLKEVSLEYKSVFVISRGARSTIIAEKGQIFEVESKIITSVNPIGCGDSMTAGIIQGILEGLSLKKAVEKGRDYATLNVQNIHPGRIL